MTSKGGTHHRLGGPRARGAAVPVLEGVEDGVGTATRRLCVCTSGGVVHRRQWKACSLRRMSGTRFLVLGLAKESLKKQQDSPSGPQRGGAAHEPCVVAARATHVSPLNVEFSRGSEWVRLPPSERRLPPFMGRVQVRRCRCWERSLSNEKKTSFGRSPWFYTRGSYSTAGGAGATAR